MFSGRLVLPPPQCYRNAVLERAATVATALGLGPNLDTLIGGVLPGGLLLRGLSGGERKRLSIGQGPSVCVAYATVCMGAGEALSFLGHRPTCVSFSPPLPHPWVSGLMSRPRVLLLDEPTSGLDSFAATVVMGHVAALARGGVTVIAALHQPRAAIWEMVNQVGPYGNILLILYVQRWDGG